MRYPRAGHVGGLFLAAILVIVCNWRNVPDGVREMLLMAFSPDAVAGGLGGTVIAGISKSMRFGISRGVFPMRQDLAPRPLPPLRLRQMIRCAKAILQ